MFNFQPHRYLLQGFAIVLLCLFLAGCGKKPGHVDPPASVMHDTFPQTYPDPATDPKP